jgi:hypothetical protein
MKIKKFALIVLSVFLSFNCYAYRPSYDVLFKNNGNPIYSGETTSADIAIKEMSSGTSYKMKVQFSRFQKKEYMLQALFDQGFSQNDVLKVSRVSNIEANNFSKSNNPMVYLFYGLLEMYLSNNNQIIVNGLKQFDINILKSQNLVNKDQQKLLQEYLYFSRKKARGRAGERDNPLRSSDPAKQTIINNILKESFYENSQKAKLVRINQRFMWSIEEKKFKAFFDQQTRKLVTLELPDFNKLTFTPVDMLVFGNFYSAPKKIVIEEAGVPKFEITFESLTNFRDNIDMFQSRAAAWQKVAATQSTERKSALSQFPSFVLQ